MAASVRTGPAGGFPWRWVGWGGAVTLLLLPLLAMRFTTEVNWTAFDFAFAAILMGSVGLALEFAFRASASRPYRVAAGIALAAAFLLVWINGAVGIIGDEGQPANLVYLVAIVAAIAGAMASRGRAAGMARAMTAAAGVTLLTPLVGYVALGAGSAVFAPDVPVATLVFTAMWLLSAKLFRKSA